jgi:hypothetical protein
MLISTALLLDSIIRNSVCTPAKLPCRRVEVGYGDKLRTHEETCELFNQEHPIGRSTVSKLVALE